MASSDRPRHLGLDTRQPSQHSLSRSRDRSNSLLSPAEYDNDAASIRSDQDSDSDDDERQARARNSRELLAHDRLVLMEEEELDQLVTETRKRKERERRGSGLVPVVASALPIPNPLTRLFSGTGSRSASRERSRSRSPNPMAASMVIPGSSSEDLEMVEKRRHRRERRRVKRERIFGEAEAGEDGELMYEMETGGLKDGSDTGQSSDRDGDSDDLDRAGLLGSVLTGEKIGRGPRRWGWKRWLFIAAIISTAFAILLLVAWKVSMTRRLASHQNYVSNGTALFAPTTIIISLDGFRADFLNRGLTPRLNALIREGVSPLYMNPSFPSVTFPNHYTLATGLYPESHGIVGNTFWDPELKEEFYYTDAARSLDPKWWRGEPFWVTAEKQGIRTAIHMWPGSEAHIDGIEPAFLDKYNGKEKLSNKVDRIFELLDKPGKENILAQTRDLRPQLIAAYVPNVDSDGHKYGPNSTEIRDTIKRADDMVDSIFRGLEQRNLTDIVNVIVVSDHGMASTDSTRLIQLEDLVDLRAIAHLDGWPLIGLRPKVHQELNYIYQDLVLKTKNNPNVEVYLRDLNMPERYHFANNERIAPLWIIPKTGWAIVKKDEMDLAVAKAQGQVYHPRGLHGYDHEHPLMRAIFIARGPAFPHPPNSRLEAFQNIEVYNILCDSIGLTPMANNGTLRLPLRPIGLHDADSEGIETPADPVEIHTYSTTSTPTSSLSATSSSSPTSTVSSFSSTSDLPNIGVSVPTLSRSSSAPTTTQPLPPATITTTKTVVSTQPAEPSATNTNDEGDDGSKKLGIWDWITDKIDKVWNKISGSP